MSRKWRIAPALAILMLLAIFISACGSDSGSGSGSSTPGATTQAAVPNCVDGSLTYDGSSALYPLANDVANLYQDKCDGATITGAQNGSGTGLQKASASSVQVGNSDIFADATKYPGLTDHQVAVVVFSVVVSPDVTGVTNLTSQQITDIYTGKITNWSAVGGPNKAITRIVRSSGSGTRITFQQYVLQGGVIEKEDASTITASGSGDVAKSLSSTPGSIGYVATSYAKKNNLTVIKIDGVEDSDANVKNNMYKFWNVEHMYTKGGATGLAKAFIDYMSSDVAEVVSARQKDGFIALSYMDQAALTAKQK